ncbi:hypothetical protein Agau_C101931 [Agrobacterium tumefaciens F2]|nr:hypothetical protein Agau_C101931 [Agrobacterium tumefaciens F2]
MIVLARGVTGRDFRLLTMRFLSPPIGTAILLADMPRRMGGNERPALRIATAWIAMSPLAVARLATATWRHRGWVGNIGYG